MTHGIFSVPTGGNINLNILTKYQLISSTNIVDAFAAHTDYQAIKNSKEFYVMISKSVVRTIFDTIFEQAQNLPNDKYSVALFKIFPSFTAVASLQLSILSINQTTSLLPWTYD